MRTYEFNGEQYRHASKHQKEWGLQLISELQLRGDETILDLGCGDGVLTDQLSKLVEKGRVLGIDSSTGMILSAKKHIKNNLQFMQLDMNDMNYADQFDVIFSNVALHWIKNHEHFLAKSFTALKINGRILWNFAANGNCSHFFEVVRSKMGENRYSKYFLDFEWPWFMPSKFDYQHLVEQAGFSEIEVVEENADRYFPNTHEMTKWIDQPSLVPFMGCIPDGIKTVFRKEVIEDMLQKTQQQDGTCFETFRRIKVKAVKL